MQESKNHENNNKEMSYNEVKEWIAQTTGGHNTEKFSDTDIEAIKRKHQKAKHKS